MKIQCAWCKKSLGEKVPYEDQRVSHGICPECMFKVQLKMIIDKKQEAFDREFEAFMRLSK